MNKPAKNYTRIIMGSLIALGSVLKLLNAPSIPSKGAIYIYSSISIIILLAGCSLLYTGLFPVPRASSAARRLR